MDDSRTPNHTTEDSGTGESGGDHGGGMSYWRFGAMIATAVLVMYGIKYLSTFELSHVEFSEMRGYMALMMGAAMGVIMLGFMLGMYRDWRMNSAIVVVSVIVFGSMFWLMRSQAAVGDESYMRSMIPHHSIAILTSERAQIDDYRVCELAEAITSAQRKEIQEMQWLLEDISENGIIPSKDEVGDRSVPKFEGTATRPGC